MVFGYLRVVGAGQHQAVELYGQALESRRVLIGLLVWTGSPPGLGFRGFKLRASGPSLKVSKVWAAVVFILALKCVRMHSELGTHTVGPY